VPGRTPLRLGRRLTRLLLWLLLLLGAGIVYPLLQVLSVAVMVDGRPTAAPLLAFIARPLFREAFVNTLVSGVLAVALGSLIAVPLALLTVRYSFYGRRWLTTLGLLPLALLTLLKNLAPAVPVPGGPWAALSLALVPLGFGYAIVVHRVFDVGGGTRGATPLGGFAFRTQAFPSLSAVLDEAADALARQLGLEHCAVFAVDGPEFGARLTAMHGRPPVFAGDRKRLDRLAAPLVLALAALHRPVAPDELADAPGGRTAGTDGERGTFADLGTSLLVPLFAADRCRAILALGPRLSGPWFDADERTRLDEFASQASVAVENAELHDRLLERAALERDVALARRIQDRLLPPAAPVLPTIEIAAHTAPAQEIGGDYYDFLTLGPRQVGIAVADVCGKGLPAALLLASVQAQLRGRAEVDPTPGAVLARLNTELCALHQPEKFVCLAFAAAASSAFAQLKQAAYIKASNTDAADLFGYSVGLSADGNEHRDSCDDGESDCFHSFSFYVGHLAKVSFGRCGYTREGRKQARASVAHFLALFKPILLRGGRGRRVVF
jgi:hypothetical protein